MMQDIAGEKINIPINVTGSGDFTIIAAQPNKAIYIYELIGDVNATTNLSVKSGASSTLGTFGLADSQGLTLTSVGNLEGVPRFVIKPNEAFILNMSAPATYIGNVYYAIRES